jgi:hypothetical protein
MSTVVFFTTLGLILGTVILVFTMHYRSAARLAQARIAGEDAAQTLAGLRGDLAEMKTRLAAVEKILKEVE